MEKENSSERNRAHSESDPSENMILPPVRKSFRQAKKRKINSSSSEENENIGTVENDPVFFYEDEELKGSAQPVPPNQ